MGECVVKNVCTMYMQWNISLKLFYYYIFEFDLNF